MITNGNWVNVPIKLSVVNAIIVTLNDVRKLLCRINTLNNNKLKKDDEINNKMQTNPSIFSL